ncbi:MAG: hypothetical protein N3A64_05535 [Desulfobacterota bacterium]|nr:hypothetical protein [Thermodesulfobacteriota bacterium]
MKYQLIEEDEFLLIKISGTSRKNEVVLSNALLKPYIQKEGIKVIADLNGVEKFEPVVLIGVLIALKKEIDLLKGNLIICSPKPEMVRYLRENYLEHFFDIYEDIEKAKNNLSKNYG